jgi:hypothetical protein
MSSQQLRMGKLAVKEFEVRHSSIQWLCADGHACRANEIVAYCNITLEPTTAQRHQARPFNDEREFQVAFAPRTAGRLRPVQNQALHGYLDVLSVKPWDAKAVLAQLEPLDGTGGQPEPDNDTFRLMFLAGRRGTELAEVHGGLLPGWHNRRRAWWYDSPGRVTTVLSLGICDVWGVVLGGTGAFTEMFEAIPTPAQIVYIPDHPLTPCVPVLLAQFLRTPAQRAAIAADLQRGLSDGAVPPTSADWVAAGILLSALEQCPIRDQYEILTPAGLQQSGPADWILLSSHAEPYSLLRHKKLGYPLHIPRHHQGGLGPAMRAWLATAFEPVRRTAQDVKQDYLRLIDTIAAQSGTRFAIFNRMSTSGQEDIVSYSAFDPPMGETLANIASKEHNLILHELAEERGIAIIDIDAMGAALGGAAHLPDSIHPSGALQAAVRAEIAQLLRT